MHGYRAASNQEMLDKVDTFKFEVLFNNWINPKVLAKYAKHPRKAWKRAYGFPYTTPVHWNKPDINSADPSPCWWRCAKLVKQISLKVFCLTFFNTCHNYKTTSAFPGDRGFCEAMCKRWRLLQVLRDPLYTEYFRTGSQPVDPGKAQILFISSQDFYHYSVTQNFFVNRSVPENFQKENFSGQVPSESLRTQDSENLYERGVQNLLILFWSPEVG